MTALNLSGYHLSFDDEFNSFTPTELGGPTWNATIFNGADTWGSENYTAGSDGGLNAYLDDGGTNPFSDANGVLTIQGTPDSPGSTGDYTTGLIDNRYQFSQTSGYFEMRAELPQGDGLWPGFWMEPTVDLNNGEPEIDAMESFGSDYEGQGGSNQVHYDLHSATNPDDRGTWATINGDIYTGYHTYGVDWEQSGLTFYVDGQSIGTLPSSADLTGGMYTIASLLTGAPGDWPGPMAGETGDLNIDYIRAYSSDPSVAQATMQTISSPDGGGNDVYGASVPGAPAPTTTGSASATPASTIPADPTATPPADPTTTASTDTTPDSTFVLSGPDATDVMGAAGPSFVSSPDATGSSVSPDATAGQGANDIASGQGGMNSGLSHWSADASHFLDGIGQFATDHLSSAATDAAAATTVPTGTVADTLVPNTMLPTMQNFSANSIHW